MTTSTSPRAAALLPNMPLQPTALRAAAECRVGSTSAQQHSFPQEA